MVDAVLFTLPDPRMGPAATDLFWVKGMTGIVVTVDGTEWTYPGRLSALPEPRRRNCGPTLPRRRRAFEPRLCPEGAR
jgi:hypothetical protein